MQTIIFLTLAAILAVIIILCIKETYWWYRLIYRKFDRGLRKERKRIKEINNLLSAYRKKSHTE